MNKKNKKYFSMAIDTEKKEASLTIYGDITSWPWLDGDVSAANLSKQLEELTDIDIINVHISSYGGEVKEGLAIYNALKNHKAKIRTYCDGFACSIASVIFMAGDERYMSEASLLMIHNAWTYVSGNAQELRKQAEDLDKITQASINAYMKKINISEEELKELLDSEYWLTYDEAIEKGFATSLIEDFDEEKVSQSVKKSLIQMILQTQKEKGEDQEEIEDDEENQDATAEESPSADDVETDEPGNENEDDNSDDEPEETTEDEEDIEEKKDKEKEKPTEMVDFFVAMIGGIEK